MSSEASMSKEVVKWLKPLNVQRVENPVGPGTPDVYYGGTIDGELVQGWLENKSIDAWPSREDSPLRVDHYSPQQRVWHVRAHRAGDVVHVLLKVGTDWLLLDGQTAALELGKVTKARLEAVAVERWPHGPAEELLQCLKRISLLRRSCTFGASGRPSIFGPLPRSSESAQTDIGAGNTGETEFLT